MRRTRQGVNMLFIFRKFCMMCRGVLGLCGMIVVEVGDKVVIVSALVMIRAQFIQFAIE